MTQACPSLSSSRGFCRRAGALLLALGCVLSFPARPVAAEEAERLAPGEGLVLDGFLREAFWKDALRLPLPPLDVPGVFGPTQAAVDLRVASVDGRLVVGVEVGEDPGTSLGLHVFLAPEGARSAAQAVTLDFRPVELRAPRLSARGPRGVGRTLYRVEGGADWSRRGVWGAELSIPFVDLVGEAVDTPLRLAVSVYTRTPNRIGTWPSEARWHGPSRWLPIAPATDTWPTAVEVDAKRLAAADAADARRAEAWLFFLKGSAIPVEPTAPPKLVDAGIQGALLAPLAQVLEARPDLAVPVACLRADIALRLGRFAAAQRDYESALAAAPGWREAAYGAFVKLARAEPGAPGAATDYAGWAAALAAARAQVGAEGYAADGLALRAALLAYRAGRFDEAIPVLDTLAARYPHDAFLANHAGFVRRARGLAATEAERVTADAEKQLPRATLQTTKGPIVLELFQDDAPNTVNNFVYLARSAFYDGVAIHRTVPAFVVQTGDGLSTSSDEEDRKRIGTGSPGYAIRSEANQRALLRGVVAMANAGPDTEGSQFFLTTGTAVHLQGEQTVFGRVAEGQDILESLTEADRILSIDLERLDPARAYHPTDASGRPAPAPRAR